MLFNPTKNFEFVPDLSVDGSVVETGRNETLRSNPKK